VTLKLAGDVNRLINKIPFAPLSKKGDLKKLSAMSREL